MRVCWVLVLLIMAVSVSWALQEQFEIAAIKQNVSGGPGSDFNFQSGGGLNCINTTLKEMILFAYNVRELQLVGATGWMDRDRYDVYAKAGKDDSSTSARQSAEESLRFRRVRLRALLADRFRLTAHSETREMPIYALVVAKGGPRLNKSTTDGISIQNQHGVIRCKNVTMKLFAENSLTRLTGRTVVDKTGLNGNYDFEIKFVEDQTGVSNDLSGPDLLTALVEQLGLRLASRKGPVEVLVVDHAGRPSEN